MPNEFIIKNGYFSQGNSNITGSLTVTGSATITGSLDVTGGITGSLLGTASFALNSAGGGSSAASNLFNYYNFI